MKIAHVCALYYPSIGGNQFHVKALSEGLVSIGEEVSVFTSNVRTAYGYAAPETQELHRQETIKGVIVNRCPINYFRRSFVLDHLVKWRGGTRLFEMTQGDVLGFWKHGPVLEKFVNEMRLFAPDIMLGVNNYSYSTLLCYKFKLRYNIPFVVMPITHAAHPWTEHPYLDQIYNKADRVVASTDFEKEVLLRRNVSEDKIDVLELGIDAHEFDGGTKKAVQKKYGFKDDEKYIAYVGRLVPFKGVECLVDSMARVWRELPNVRLVLAGTVDRHFDQILQKHLEQYPDELRQNIIQIGSFSEEEKKHLYDVFDVIAMPSNVDNFGLVYLESWAAGKPVIACRDTPQETIIDDGQNGLLVSYGNQGHIADAIIKLMKDAALRRIMGENGRAAVEGRFSKERYIKRVQKMYEDVLKNCHG